MKLQRVHDSSICGTTVVLLLQWGQHGSTMVSKAIYILQDTDVALISES